MEHRRFRILLGIVFGTLIALANQGLEIYFASHGVPPAGAFFNDFVIGSVAALLAYTWVTLLAERHLREFAAEKQQQEAVPRECIRNSFRSSFPLDSVNWGASRIMIGFLTSTCISKDIEALGLAGNCT